ncbi:metal-dependent hydrolase [Thermosulfuriphilus sp.]
MPTRITFLGHATFKIETATGLKVIIDPWINNPQAPEDKDIGPYDLILITHAHGDHLGDVLEIGKSGGEIVAIHEIQQYLLAKGLSNVVGMNIGGTYHTQNLSITMVTALHSSSIQEADRLIYGGDACGFVIRMENGLTVYHAGDTGLFGDMRLIGELYRPDVALLPIGDHYVMGPKEAAYAASLINAEKVIPMHYGTFPALTGTVEEFRNLLERMAPGVEMIELVPGQSLTIRR